MGSPPPFSGKRAVATLPRKRTRAAIAATDLRDALGKHDGRVLLLACYDALAGRGLPKRAGGKLLRSVKERLPALKAAFEAHVATQAPAAPKPTCNNSPTRSSVCSNNTVS